MNNSCLSLCIAALFLVIPACLLSQTWEPEKSFKEAYAYGCGPETPLDEKHRPFCGVVIALHGLKMRTAPSFEAKTLAVIPFGETVWRTKNAYDLKPAYGADSPMTSDSISGYWQEITWKGKKGFAFSAFIGNAILRMTEPAYLLFESDWNCWNDAYASLAYHYYGVVPNADSSRWHLKKINPSFVFNEDDFTGTTIRSGLKKPPFFMVASKNPLREGLLMSEKTQAVVYHDDIHAANRAIISKKTRIPTSTFVLNVETSSNPAGEKHPSLILSEKATGRKQILLPDLYATEVKLLWSGDLDSDGTMDFLLSYSTDETYCCQLFLSSLAKGKELVKPLKIYWYGDCC